MRLALVLGEAQGNSVKPKLKSVKDNLDIDVFGSIPKFIDSSLKRSCIYDRILILDSMFTGTTLNDLYNYWCATSKDTTVVMLGKKGKSDNLASEFMQTFLSTNVSAMLVETTTVQILAESVLLDTRTITSKYGIKDYLKVEVDLDEYEEPKVEEPQPQPTVVTTPQTSDKKKKGLFGGLFGGKSNKEKHEEVMRAIAEKQNQAQQVVNTQQVVDTQSDMNQQYNMQQDMSQQYVNSQDDYNIGQEQINYNDSIQDNSYSESTDFDNQENFNEYDNQYEEPIQESMDFSSQEDNSSVYSGIHTGESQEQDGVSDFNDEEFFQESDISDNSIENSAEYEETNELIEDDFVEDNIEINDEVDKSLESDIKEDFNIDSVKQAEVEDDFDFSETNMMFGSSDDSFNSSSTIKSGEPQTDIYSKNNDFEPEKKHSNIDFSYTRAYEGNEVDDIDLSSVNVANAEEAYRQKAEQPKVVTQTIVKEVVKNVGIGGGSVLKSVYAGRQKKVVIVTGDRGTGVTTTALKLAHEFAKHVPVLYFDCDVDNHGLLSYIDYSQFRNYEPIHMQGVKLCRNSKAFNNCLVAFDTNIDILTTDYSCDTTDDELEQAQGVVAEKSNEYGVVIVDCPVNKLHCISDLLLTGVTVMCVEASKRGFMNMLCRFETCPLQLRYKRSIVSKGVMFLTKCNKDLNNKKLLEYVNSLFQPDEVDWLSMEMKPFNGKLNDNLLNEILEG